MATDTPLLSLTGSRFFGTARADSDYDYFVADSPAMRACLEMDGYRHTWECIIPDGDLRALYKRDGVDVQLRRDPYTFSQLQSLIRESGFAEAMKNKRFAYALWRFAFACVAIGRSKRNG